MLPKWQNLFAQKTLSAKFPQVKMSFVKMSDRLLIAQIGSFEFPK